MSSKPGSSVDGFSAFGSVEGSTTISGTSSSKQKAEESLFSVLFTLTQHGKSGKLVPFLSFVIDFLQMIGFVFSENFPWGRSTEQTVSKMLSFVQLQAPSFLSGYQDFLVIFWFVVVIIGLALADVVFVSNMFKKNEFNHMWPVKFLRFFVSLLATVFFIPFFNVLLKPLDCHYTTSPPGLDAYPDIPCWGAVNAFHSAVAIIAAVLFCAFSLIVVLVFVDPDPTANQPLSTPHSFFDLILLLSRIILSSSSTFLSEHVGWLAAINFLVHATSFCAVVYMCPYFMLSVTRLRSGFFSVLAFSAAILVGVVQHGSAESEIPSIIFAAGLVPVFCFGYMAPLWRLQRLCQQAVSHVQPTRNLPLTRSAASFSSQENIMLDTQPNGQSQFFSKSRKRLQKELSQSTLPGATHEAKEPLVFRTILEVELATRFLQHDKSPQCLATASKIFEEGSAMFPNSPLLLLMNASFAQFYLKNLQTAQNLVSKANALNPFFGFRFLIYRKTREMFTKGEIDMISAVDFKRHYAGAHKNHLMCVKAMMRLWRHLLPNRVNVVALPEVLEKIYQTEERAEMHFKHLLRKYKSPRVLRAYGSFLADCKNSQSLGLKYFAAAEDMEEEHVNEHEERTRRSEASSFQVTTRPDVLKMSTSSLSNLDLQPSPAFEIFNAASPSFASLPVILLTPHGEITNMSHHASEIFSTDPLLHVFNEKFSKKFLSGQSSQMFDNMIHHASGVDVESGAPTNVSEGFLIVLQKIPIYYKLFKLVSPIFDGEDGGFSLALVFDKGEVGEKRGEAIVDQETATIQEADFHFSSLFGARHQELIGTDATPHLHSVGCHDLDHSPQLIYTQDHHHHSYWHLLEISKPPLRPTTPNSNSKTNRNNSDIPHSPQFSVQLTIRSLFLGLESPLSQVDFFGGDVAGVGGDGNGGGTTQNSGMGVDGDDNASQMVSPAREHMDQKEMMLKRKRSMLTGSVTSTELSTPFGGAAALKSILDDGLDVKKKSTVAIFHRNIRIGLVVMALFAIGCYVTILTLAGQTEQTLANERDAGMLSTMSQRMVTQARTVELYSTPWVTSQAELIGAQVYLASMVKDFYALIYKVYYLGDQLKYKPLHDIYYNPTVLLYQLGAPGENATSVMSSVWDAERLYAYHSKIAANLGVNDTKTQSANASCYWTSVNGPYGVKDALTALSHTYRDFSLYSLSQIVAIESTVLGSSIAVLIGLIFVVQLSLRLVHKDKVRSIDLFLMIPKPVIQGLLNRKYMILEEMNELKDPNEQPQQPPPLWLGTPVHEPQNAQGGPPQDTPDFQSSGLPPFLPPIPPIPSSTVRFTSSQIQQSSHQNQQSFHPHSTYSDSNHLLKFALHQNFSKYESEVLSDQEGRGISPIVSSENPEDENFENLENFGQKNIQNPTSSLRYRIESESDMNSSLSSAASSPHITPLVHHHQHNQNQQNQQHNVNFGDWTKSQNFSDGEMGEEGTTEISKWKNNKSKKKSMGILFSKLSGTSGEEKNDREEEDGEGDIELEGLENHQHKVPGQTQKVSKSFEQALQSPAVRVFTKQYGLVIAIIAGLLITSFILTSQAIDETSNICKEIDLSSSRNYLSVHIRHLARELVITQSPQMAQYIKDMIVMLLKIHSALLYGDTSLGVKGSALRYAPQETMLYGEGCMREDQTLCPKPGTPYYIQINSGLATLLRDYLEVFMRFVDSKPQYWTFSNPDYPFIFDANIAIKNIRDGLQILTDLYLQEAKGILQHSVDIQLYITLSILFLLVLVYILVFRPMIRFIRDETRRTCAMLLMLPADLVSSMPEIRAFITDKQAELTDEKHH